jgi:hypothetical protein
VEFVKFVAEQKFVEFVKFVAEQKFVEFVKFVAEQKFVKFVAEQKFVKFVAEQKFVKFVAQKESVWQPEHESERRRWRRLWRSTPAPTRISATSASAVPAGVRWRSIWTCCPTR